MAEPADLDNVFLLANWDGTDGDTTYTPEIGPSPSFVGNAQLDDSVTQFTNTTAYVDGDGDKITWGAAADAQFLHDDTIDWTVEFWARRTSLAAAGYIFATRGTNCGVILEVNEFGGVGFYIFNHSGFRFFEISADEVVSANTMHYFKITYDQSTRACKVRVDGSVVISATAGTFSGTADSNFALTLGTAAHSTFRQCEVNFGPVRVTKNEVLDDGDVPSGVFSDTPILTGIISAPSPLGSMRVLAVNDFTSLVKDTRIFYEMHITGSPPVVMPISSWQATLQVDRSNFLQCVVPAVDDFVSIISARQGSEEFVVSRVAVDGGSRFETEIARAPLTTTSISRGATNYTCTMSGYDDAPESPTSPKTRLLTGVRSIAIDGSGRYRVRADVDWFLRPGDTASVDGDTFTASYINYYTTSQGDSYMDVGDR